MKISLSVVFLISFLYILLLFFIALISNILVRRKRRVIYNPYIYALSIGVYCTAWTYYGSVGRASVDGIEFLAIYIGPTLMVFSWWFLLRKMVNIVERHNINNLADFVSFRFGRSKRVGLVVAVVCVVGIIPYISLQLKSINETILILADLGSDFTSPLFFDTSFYVSLFIGILASLFGVHHIAEGRKHPALVGVIAFESVVKLIILLIAGGYVVYLSGGFSQIFGYLYTNQNDPAVAKLIVLDKGNNSYGKWFSMMVMSMFAVMFLPRQFQMAVVENDSPKHIKEAMYLFPLYLFLINLFVIPIAISGKLFLTGDYNPDYTILYILRDKGSLFFMVLVYIGGLAAATGMIIVASVSLSNMFVNNIIVHVFVKLLMFSRFGKYITSLKRLMVIIIILAGYFFYRYVGEFFSLVDLGLVSFAAISQIAPAVVLGLFVKRLSRDGVFWGIISGSIVWFYTLVVPYFAKAGIIDYRIVTDGLFGLAILKPTELLGLTGLDSWSHTLFWSMLLNIVILTVISLVSEQNEEEKETASLCVDSLKLHFLLGKEDVSRSLSLTDINNILSNFFGNEYAKKVIDNFLNQIGKERRDLNVDDIKLLVDEVKTHLSSAVGPSASEIIINSYLEMAGKTGRDVMNVFKDLVSLGVGESRDTLIHRITELNILLEISRQFTSTTDLVKKLQNAIDIIRNNLKIDLVVIRKRSGDTLETVVYSGDINSFKMISNIRRIDSQKTYIGRTFVTGKAVYIDDIDNAMESEYINELKNRGVRSFCHIPLVIDGKVEGVLSLFSKTYKNLFSREFVNILESIVSQMAFLMDNHNKAEELIKIKEVSKELEIAKMIQASLVSVDPFSFEGIKVVSAYSPSVYVGGDYYDIIRVDEEQVDIIISDVSGHSISSALIMSQIRSIIHTSLSINKALKPSDMLHLITKQIFPQINRYNFIITMLYIRLNLFSGDLTMANAGHYNPILIKDGEVIELRCDGVLIGVFDDMKYLEEKYNIKTGDCLVLFTDGVVESENENGEFFGKERFLNILKEHAYMEPEKIRNAILTSLSAFTKNYVQKDDISLLIIKKV
ncbi:MAG: SpoIIE family protein phosphatase [Calditerrivibrio sp.]|nr:SpoIIE family protein phosphatase [Calditerrivibrio sp.]